MAILGFFASALFLLYLTGALIFATLGSAMLGNDQPGRYTLAAGIILICLWVVLFMNSPFTIAVN